MDKLLPCPWCQKAPSESLIDGDRIFACATENCPAEGYPYHESDWNRRPAPQAQEETRGAPAPTVKCLYCGKVSDLGRGAVVYEPQAPAPASTAGLRDLREWVDVLQRERIPIEYDSLRGWLDRLSAAPEAGAPGTQEGGSQP